jgi:hypothetical protein
MNEASSLSIGVDEELPSFSAVVPVPMLTRSLQDRYLFRPPGARLSPLTQLSLFAASNDAKSLILKGMHTNSLHYKANVLLAGTGDGRAVIFGGGCLGKVRRKWSSNRRCSGSGWV